MSIVQEIKESFRENNIVVKLIYVNVGVFAVLRIFDLLMMLAGSSLQGSLTLLLAMPTTPEGMIVKPWTVITYMFSHYDFIHIIFNLLCLHWFGRLFCYLIGEHLVMRTYLIGGLAGAVACLLGAEILPVGSVMLGASAAILALLLAVAVYAPNYSVGIVFIGQVKLKYYALALVLIDIVSIPGLYNAGGHIAHLGGALAGVILALRWKRNGVPVPSRTSHSFNWNFLHRKRMKVVQRRPLTDMEYNAQRAEREREVDRILEKIKKSGYDSLSEKERRLLFEESNK